MCLARKVITPATVADHITPHKGDHQSFYWGSCSRCADTATAARKKQQETHGYQRDVGADGWPPIRTIRPTSQGLKGGRARPGNAARRWMLRAPRIDAIALFSFMGPGGHPKNSESAAL